MSRNDTRKQTLRLLRFLDGNGLHKVSSLTGCDNELALVLAIGSQRQISCTANCLQGAVSGGLVMRNGDTIRLTRAGEAHLQRAAAGADSFQHQHRTMGSKRLVQDGKVESHAVNLEESPLTRLHARRRADGTPWIDEEHLVAGERLRRDFAMGQLMQSTTSNWDFSQGMGRKNGGGGGKAEITETAIDARRRLEEATRALGPELSGLLTDVCCYLKGLELVERERRWPPRSAKLMLRTGLDLLARHYGTRSGFRSPT